MDLWHKVLKWLDYNRGVAVGLVITIVAAVWIVGCQPKTTSLLASDRVVTAKELGREVVIVQQQLDTEGVYLGAKIDEHNAKVEAANKSIELAEADLAEQIEMRKQIIEVVGGLGTVIASGGLTAPAAIGSIMQLALLGLAGGASVDIVRKNRIINKLKNGA